MKFLGIGLMACALCAAAIGADIESDVQTEAKPWTSLDLNNSPDTIRFAVVADNSGGPRAGVWAESIAKLNLMQPEFVVGTGDYIEGYEDTREGIDAQRDHFMGEMAKLEVPFFFVPGNHDVGRPMWKEAYNARYGVTYYHFVYKNVLFLCLNTNDGPDANTGIGDQQVEYATKVLAEHPDVRWTFVFQHKPLWNEKDNPAWERIEAALQGRKCTVFAGHTHNYLSQEEHAISFITQATTGGGSPLRGAAYGEFDAMVWVTLTDEGPHVANLLLDGILDKDIRTPETAKALALFRADRAVTATPVLVEGPQFESGASRVVITNPLDAPLRIKVLSEAQPGVRVEPASLSAIVPPKGEHAVDLKLSADQPLPVAQTQPVVLHWQAFYDKGDNTPSTEFGGERRITVDAPFAIPARADAPVVDGKLDDWTDLPFVVDQPSEVWHNVPAWKGPQDGSFRFAVARDDQYLYVAVKATDNEPCFDGWKYWEDLLLLFVDARATAQDDIEKSVFGVLAGPQVSPEQAAEYSQGKAPEGLKSASLATPDGFEAEFAIPAAYLNERQGGDWKQVRLNIAFDDFDRGDARDGVTMLYWRPQWEDPKSYPEAGLFRR